MRIENAQLDVLFSTRLERFDSLFSRAAFVISQKDEPIKTLLGVLACLPAHSPVVISSNCPLHSFAQLKQGLALASGGRDVFLVHQKDPLLAALLRDRGVFHILGHDDGLVVNGKGEEMYVGTLCTMLLDPQPQWVIYYDADNQAPAALLRSHSKNKKRGSRRSRRGCSLPPRAKGMGLPGRLSVKTSRQRRYYMLVA